MRRLMIAASAIAALAFPVDAAQIMRTDANGQSYTVTMNEHGAKFRAGGEEFYLGQSCDAFHPDKGRGSWGWANGGFCATFPDGEICFPRQDVPVQTEGYSDCRF